MMFLCIYFFKTFYLARLQVAESGKTAWLRRKIWLHGYASFFNCCKRCKNAFSAVAHWVKLNFKRLGYDTGIILLTTTRRNVMTSGNDFVFIVEQMYVLINVYIFFLLLSYIQKQFMSFIHQLKMFSVTRIRVNLFLLLVKAKALESYYNWDQMTITNEGYFFLNILEHLRILIVYTQK